MEANLAKRNQMAMTEPAAEVPPEVLVLGSVRETRVAIANAARNRGWIVDEAVATLDAIVHLQAPNCAIDTVIVVPPVSTTPAPTLVAFLRGEFPHLRVLLA